MIQRTWNGSVWLPWAPRGDGIGGIADRRKARIWQLDAPEISFRAFDYPDAIADGRVVAPLTALGAVEKGRRIILEDDGAPHPVATVPAAGSEERRVGQECVRTCSTRWEQ